MFQWMKNAFLAAVSWVQRSDIEALPPALEPPKADNEDPWSFEREDIEQSGHFYFRRGILDQLEQYFICLRRMRRMDPEAYGLYSKVGAHVIPSAAIGDTIDPPPLWRLGQAPAFGAVSFIGERKDDDPKSDTVYAKFVYFQKLKSLVPEVQPAPSSIFRCTMFYDDPDDPKLPWGFPVSFHCYLGADNRFHLLKELVRTSRHVTRRVNSYHGSKTRKTHEAVAIPSTGWAYPRQYMSVFEEKRNRHLTPEDVAHTIMCLASSFYECAASSTRVTVSKGSLNAVFGVDIKRTPYFFKDRDRVETPSGARKRIFHIVRAHPRRRADGSVTHVKFHFRGAREFIWNSYRVLITVPGLHHNDVLELTPGAEVMEKRRGYVDMPALGKMIDRHIQGASP